MQVNQSKSYIYEDLKSISVAHMYSCKVTVKFINRKQLGQRFVATGPLIHRARDPPGLRHG